MSAPVTLRDAQADGWDDSEPVKCARCGNHDYPDEMIPVDGELLCGPCAEVVEEGT
jgi:formylmethanofuran dehydrogenase subunit E